jgi:hypothetical protein
MLFCANEVLFFIAENHEITQHSFMQQFNRAAMLCCMTADVY